MQKVKQQLRPETPTIVDFVFLDNDSFQLYIRKKPLFQLKPIKVSSLYLFRARNFVVGYSQTPPQAVFSSVSAAKTNHNHSNVSIFAITVRHIVVIVGII